MNPLNQSIHIAGGLRPLAQRLGVSYQAIQQWRVRGQPPAERCLAIERLTGISRYALRPDVYGPAPGKKTRRSLSQPQQAA